MTRKKEARDPVKWGPLLKCRVLTAHIRSLPDSPLVLSLPQDACPNIIRPSCLQRECSNYWVIPGVTKPKDMLKGNPGTIMLSAGMFQRAFREVIKDVDLPAKTRKEWERGFFIYSDHTDVTPQVFVRCDTGCCKQKYFVHVGKQILEREHATFPLWDLTLRCRFDESRITPTRMANLIERAGAQVGIGKWRPATGLPNGRWSLLGYDVQ